MTIYTIGSHNRRTIIDHSFLFFMRKYRKLVCQLFGDCFSLQGSSSWTSGGDRDSGTPNKPNVGFATVEWGGGGSGGLGISVGGRSGNGNM